VYMLNYSWRLMSPLAVFCGDLHSKGSAAICISEKCHINCNPTKF
jgi:hypothetical protein